MFKALMTAAVAAKMAVEGVGVVLSLLDDDSDLNRLIDKTLSKTLYISSDKKVLRINERIVIFALEKNLSKDYLAEIKSIKVKSGFIEVLHARFGLFKIRPHYIEFKEDCTCMSYDVTMQDAVDRRNKKYIQSFALAILGGVCLGLTSCFVGASLIEMGVSHAAQAYLEGEELIGMNKKYYMLPLSAYVTSALAKKINDETPYLGRKFILTATPSYIDADLSSLPESYLDELQIKTAQFIEQSKSWGAEFLSVTEHVSSSVAKLRNSDNSKP